MRDGLSGRGCEISQGSSFFFPGSYRFPLQAQEEALPDTLTSYIDAHNKVAAFSTPQERVQLAKFDSPESVRRATDTQRLADVFASLQEVKAMEIDVDPGMQGHPPNNDGEQSELLEVARVSQEAPDRWSVEVYAYRLPPETNRKLISAYEDAHRVRPAADAATQPHRRVQHWK